jgi:predicted dinucleotide-utilizing enzyme
MMADAATTKRTKAKRRELAPLEPIDAQDGPAKLGPKMQALTEKQRNFVIALFAVRQGHGAAVRAARAAGWGTPSSSAQSMATISSRLMHNDAIIEGMREYGEQFLKAAGPAALRALEKMILTPSHKGHERSVAAVVDRLYAVETRHLVDVHHHAVDHSAEAVAHLRMLKSLDVSRSKLEEVFGFSGLSRYERLLEIEEAKKSPRLIEGTAVEIREAS